MLSNFNEFNYFDDFNNLLFSKKENQLMKTDIIVQDDNYILEMDLPGCKKDNIQIELKNGYLHINATINNFVDESDKKSYIHKERFYGQCSRSFYVGDNVTENDINASFKEGILKVVFPKNNINNVNNKYIKIND